MIGTVSTDEKAEIARAHGCTHVIVTSREDIARRVRELTDGNGVPVVYDGVGKATFEGSLDSLAPLGMMVSFGNASGVVPPVDLRALASRGSLFLTRPTLMAYTARREDLLAHAGDLFEVVQNGAVRVEVTRTYPLAEASRAHRDLEGRKTTGSSVFTL
jgi:NADPH2:quinone reductase